MQLAIIFHHTNSAGADEWLRSLCCGVVQVCGLNRPNGTFTLHGTGTGNGNGTGDENNRFLYIMLYCSLCTETGIGT